MTHPESFRRVFDELRTILASYEYALHVEADTAEHYSLNTPHAEQYGRELFFGAVQIKKNYVSYHLMPLYIFPDLLDDLPPLLQKRKHGKSCFNFTTVGSDELQALSALTRSSFDRLKREDILDTDTESG